LALAKVVNRQAIFRAESSDKTVATQVIQEAPPGAAASRFTIVA
jgi:hypothetical protein